MVGYRMTLHQLRWFFYHGILNMWLCLMNLMGLHSKWPWPASSYYPSREMLRKAKKKTSVNIADALTDVQLDTSRMHAIIVWLDTAWLLLSRNVFKFNHVIFVTLFHGSSIDYVFLLLLFTCMFSVWHDTLNFHLVSVTGFFSECVKRLTVYFSLK
jgi:hypothetical protein